MMAAIIPPAPRDQIAEIAHDNGWHRAVDLGARMVDDYTRAGRHIHLRWSPLELNTFIKIDSVMHEHGLNGFAPNLLGTGVSKPGAPKSALKAATVMRYHISPTLLKRIPEHVYENPYALFSWLQEVCRPLKLLRFTPEIRSCIYENVQDLEPLNCVSKFI